MICKDDKECFCNDRRADTTKEATQDGQNNLLKILQCASKCVDWRTKRCAIYKKNSCHLKSKQWFKMTQRVFTTNCVHYIDYCFIQPKWNQNKSSTISSLFVWYHRSRMTKKWHLMFLRFVVNNNDGLFWSRARVSLEGSKSHNYAENDDCTHRHWDASSSVNRLSVMMVIIRGKSLLCRGDDSLESWVSGSKSRKCLSDKHFLGARRWMLMRLCANVWLASWLSAYEKTL